LGVGYSAIATVTTAAGPTGAVYGEGQALITARAIEKKQTALMSYLNV
jgi:hypothetical protein